MNHSQDSDGLTLGLVLQKTFLRTLVVSVILCAILAILAILSGDWGGLEIRIMLTTAIISGCSLGGLACGAYFGTGRGKILPVTGIVLAIAAALMTIGLIWFAPGSEALVKLTASISIFAFACAHLSLLSIARLSPAYNWSLWLARFVIFGVACFIILMLWVEFAGFDNLYVVFAVGAVIDAAVTVLIPIFHHLSKGDVEFLNKQSAASSSPAAQIMHIDKEIETLRFRISELEQEKFRLQQP